jgi:hypothetical protein
VKKERFLSKKKKEKEYFWQYNWQNGEKNVSLYLKNEEPKVFEPLAIK